MGKWEPLFWIIGTGVAFLVVLMLLEFLKRKKKKS